MPIRKVPGGWKWGNHGKVYPTRAGAERQAAAAHAHGFVEKSAPSPSGTLRGSSTPHYGFGNFGHGLPRLAPTRKQQVKHHLADHHEFDASGMDHRAAMRAHRDAHSSSSPATHEHVAIGDWVGMHKSFGTMTTTLKKAADSATQIALDMTYEPIKAALANAQVELDYLAHGISLSDVQEYQNYVVDQISNTLDSDDPTLAKQKGWTKASHEKWWKHIQNAAIDPSILTKGPHTHCAEKMDGKVSNPHAFCAWAEHSATGHWPGERRSDKTEEDAVEKLEALAHNRQLDPGKTNKADPATTDDPTTSPEPHTVAPAPPSYAAGTTPAPYQHIINSLDAVVRNADGLDKAGIGGGYRTSPSSRGNIGTSSIKGHHDVFSPSGEKIGHVSPTLHGHDRPSTPRFSAYREGMSPNAPGAVTRHATRSNAARAIAMHHGLAQQNKAEPVAGTNKIEHPDETYSEEDPIDELRKALSALNKWSSSSVARGKRERTPNTYWKEQRARGKKWGSLPSEGNMSPSNKEEFAIAAKKQRQADAARSGEPAGDSNQSRRKWRYVKPGESTSGEVQVGPRGGQRVAVQPGEEKRPRTAARPPAARRERAPHPPHKPSGFAEHQRFAPAEAFREGARAYASGRG